MMNLVQVLLLSLQWFEANGGPILFEGISYKRSFDISFKPLPIKPLTFIKEKWSPFGVFKKKHTILRRDVGSTDLKDISGSESIPVGISIEKETSLVVAHNVDESLVDSVPSPNGALVIVPAAPVSEDTEPVTVAPLYIQPVGIQPVVPQSILTQNALSPGLVPIVEQPVEAPSPPVLVAVPTEEVVPPPPEIVPQIEPEILPVPPPPTEPIPPQKPIPLIEEPVAVSPVVAQPLPPVPIIVPPGAAPASPPQIVPLVLDKPSIPGSVVLPSGGSVPGSILSTGTIEDIAPVAPQPPINTVLLENKSPDILTNIFKFAPSLLKTPFEKKISPILSNSIDGSGKQNESYFIRGSKMALHLGNVVSQAMSKFFNNARFTLDRLTNPPPIYLN